jgi:deoxyribodipyrimidine photo-lyase
MTAIVWIRRSLRKYDNTALVEASKKYDEVIPFYVIDDEYFETAELGYPRVKFWHDSLVDLKESLQDEGRDLVVRKGKPVEQLKKIIEESGAEAVYFNRDYSPYSKQRDQNVEELGNDLGIDVESFKDIVMFEKKEILTNSGSPYKVYSYYRDKWFDRDKPRPEKPEEFDTPDLTSDVIPSVKELGFEKPEEIEWIWEPGREGGKKRLEEFKDKIWSYDEKRDLAAEDETSKLSPHLKFGTISIREAFWMAERIKARNPDKDTSGIETWQEELAWRDFYFQVMWNFPYCVEKPFLDQYESIEWEEDEEKWQRFIEGKTGYPFVDAGMRQLKTTGWMHNRLRMVVTSFCAKDLHLDWKKLHSYFKKMFVDAELSAMIGGIQWAYSIGTDAQPYFRVFNPWTQGEDYDPKGEYIRKWVPELEDVPDEHIHKPYKMNKLQQEDCGVQIGEDYPEPIVDHDEERKKAVEMFEEARED